MVILTTMCYKAKLAESVDSQFKPRRILSNEALLRVYRSQYVTAVTVADLFELNKSDSSPK